jgi:RNA polymerase sigma-70 factor (ECF subfamily)
LIDAHRRLFGAQKRSASREVGLGSPGDDTQHSPLINLLVASMTSPSAAFSRDQKEMQLAHAIEALPEEGREALRLRYVEGLPTREIAARLGNTDGAVRVLLTRSLMEG